MNQFPGSPSIGDRRRERPAGFQLEHSCLRAEVFATGRPEFSTLFIGSVSRKPIVTVTVPVIRAGKVVYDLSFNPPQEILQRIIEQQRPDNDWTISIFDQTGPNFARVPNPEGTLGQKAHPTLYALMFDAPEGQAHTTSLEGVPLLTAFSRSELSGWTPAAGIAEHTLTAPALHTFFLAGSIGLVMLLIGLIFVLRMASQIARGEALQALLINELNHRVKNTLATVQSMSAQTFRGAADAEAREKFSSRLVALGSAHDLLSESRWAGADLRQTLEVVPAPYQGASGRITFSGPELQIDARTVTILSMVIQELATNAAKYGALGHDGRVRVSWEKVGPDGAPFVTLRWREHDGPPVKAPLRTGFGSTLIERGFAAQLGGSAKLSFEPDGVVCVLDFPLR